jgi:hypothetical protein
MLRLVTGLALVLAFMAPARADEVSGLRDRCSARPSGTLQVDGAKATEAQMKAVRDEVAQFMTAADDYVACVSLYANADAKTLSPADKQKLLNIVGQVVDEKEEVGCGFQKQLDVYNKAHKLPGVEFDQICLDRFARTGSGGGTPAPGQ